jgi:IS30 family transposase
MPCGTNENTNGLVRQYLPKGSDLSGHSQGDLNAIAEKLNDRPRKCLEFQTPSEVFEQIILKAENTNSNVALHS